MGIKVHLVILTGKEKGKGCYRKSIKKGIIKESSTKRTTSEEINTAAAAGLTLAGDIVGANLNSSLSTSRKTEIVNFFKATTTEEENTEVDLSSTHGSWYVVEPTTEIEWHNGDIRVYKGGVYAIDHQLTFKYSQNFPLEDELEQGYWRLFTQKWTHWDMYVQDNGSGNVRGWHGDPGPQGHFKFQRRQANGQFYYLISTERSQSFPLYARQGYRQRENLEWRPRRTR